MSQLYTWPQSSPRNWKITTSWKRPSLFLLSLIKSTSLSQLHSLTVLHRLYVSTGRVLIVVDAGECLLSGRLRLPSDWYFPVWMGHQWCGLPQTRSCHSSSIWPVSPGGKRWFRELLCFPFTEKIRIKMNQGLFFFFFFWKLRIRGKRKTIMTF